MLSSHHTFYINCFLENVSPKMIALAAPLNKCSHISALYFFFYCQSLKWSNFLTKFKGKKKLKKHFTLTASSFCVVLHCTVLHCFNECFWMNTSRILFHLIKSKSFFLFLSCSKNLLCHTRSGETNLGNNVIILINELNDYFFIVVIQFPLNTFSAIYSKPSKPFFG